MIKITFPDLSVKEFENGVTANQIAQVYHLVLLKNAL